MTIDPNDLLEQLDRHLACPNQTWLFGAGISKQAGVPLMHPLTDRVRAKAAGTPHQAVLDSLFGELPAGSHIEHFLSHVADYATLAERAKSDEVTVGGSKITAAALTDAHRSVVEWIGDTVRWGYKAAADGQPEAIGKSGAPIVTVDGHTKFVQALFKTAQAGLQDRRGPVQLFTTNYDTLLEDALALCSVTYWDGFLGGGVAFRNHHFGEEAPAGYRAHVAKLHGSIDWYAGDDGKIWRVRAEDGYPPRNGRVLIHPQVTKYIATQRDPFSAQFDLFRKAFATKSDNVATICGYSFGDDHINQEIELAMAAPSSRTTMLVFYYEGAGWADCLAKWRLSSWGGRIYIATEKGLYHGAEGPYHLPAAGKSHDWWTFEGVTKILRDGAEGSYDGPV
jgi:hypothetical protein